MRSRKNFPWTLVGIAVVVVVASIGIIYAFSGAKVEVTPAASQITVSGSFTATPSSGDLPYEVITVDKVGSKEVNAEGSETANDPASGTITIYNAQAKPQQLIANTRFETSDGLIFRIHDSVTVPAGTDAAPGSIQAAAFADAGGDKYNIGPSTFTLPGLKGGAAFDKVYAKSTAGMTGGFSGTRPSVSDKTKQAQAPAIEQSLGNELKADIAAKVGEDHILIPGAVFITYVPQPPVAGENGKVKVQEKGTATAYVFPKQALAKAIAYQTIGSYAGQTVTIPDAGTLAFTPSGGAAPVPGAPSMTFSLAGNTTVVWVVDPAKIAGSVAGKSKQAATTILAGFPEVEKAILSLKPFWAGTFPDDPAKITITLKEPKTK